MLSPPGLISPFCVFPASCPDEDSGTQPGCSTAPSGWSSSRRHQSSVSIVYNSDSEVYRDDSYPWYIKLGFQADSGDESVLSVQVSY